MNQHSRTIDKSVDDCDVEAILASINEKIKQGYKGLGQKVPSSYEISISFHDSSLNFTVNNGE